MTRDTRIALFLMGVLVVVEGIKRVPSPWDDSIMQETKVGYVV